ncbi:unnamed protein product [Mytilus edulis]|uniref:Ig-like domain-containing protein n=1 Tax=Mytilus edulis TaxID=6550 RepID=A0A8S3UCP5_MYTED|nr:unnamed protein product [Mytilus edulis]
MTISINNNHVDLSYFYSGFFSTTFADSTPEIASKLPNITTEGGTDVRFHCTVTNRGDSSIQWWYVSGKKSIAIGLQFGKGISHDKYHVVETSNTSDITVSTLTVRSVHSKDEGMYRCVIRIPRVAYPAWPKENGFIYIQENHKMATEKNSLVSTTEGTKQGALDINIEVKPTNNVKSSTVLSDKQTGQNTASCLINGSFLVYACAMIVVILILS